MVRDRVVVLALLVGCAGAPRHASAPPTPSPELLRTVARGESALRPSAAGVARLTYGLGDGDEIVSEARRLCGDEAAALAVALAQRIHEVLQAEDVDTDIECVGDTCTVPALVPYGMPEREGARLEDRSRVSLRFQPHPDGGFVLVAVEEVETMGMGVADYWADLERWFGQHRGEVSTMPCS